MQKSKITPKLAIAVHVVLPVLLTVSLFICTIYVIVLPFLKENMMNSKREMLKELTTTAREMLDEYDERVAAGELSLKEAQQRAIKRIRSLRYGPELKDYFWLCNMKSYLLMHPYRLDLAGKDQSKFTDPAGKVLFVEMAEVVKKDGEGYVEYMWQWKDNPKRVVPKISHVRGFAPWGWFVGTGMYLEDVNAQINAITKKLNIAFTVILCVISLISIYLIWQGSITEKKRSDTEEAIRKSEESLRKTKLYLDNIINSMPSALIAIDSDGNISNMNHVAEKLAGKSNIEATGCSIIEIFPEYQDYLDEIQRSIKEHECIIKEKILQKINDSVHVFNMIIYPLVTNKVQGAVIRIDDVTEKTKMEEMMILTEKTLSIGGLTAGIAHEINNPLGIILQSLNNIERRLSSSLETNIETAVECGINLDKLQAYIEKRKISEFMSDVKNAAQRAATIVKGMLQFTRKTGIENMRDCDPIPIIKSSIELVASDYDLKEKYDFKSIKIIENYDPNIKSIWCNETEIKQVFLNLLRNASQAIRNKKYKEPESPTITISLQADNEMARIEIEDNGPGISEEIKKRIFEPFFTTKEAGTGTGLGLSVSHFIIDERHNGIMRVESKLGTGTKFIISLPFEKT